MQLLARIRAITMKDRDLGHDDTACLGSLIAEIGEYTIARQVELGQRVKELSEGSRSECVDIAICALALFYVNGGDDEYLVARAHEKLDKWERNQRGPNAESILPVS